MHLDSLDDLVRRYLSTALAVVVILVAPATGPGPLPDRDPPDRHTADRYTPDRDTPDRDAAVPDVAPDGTVGPGAPPSGAPSRARTGPDPTPGPAPGRPSEPAAPSSRPSGGPVAAAPDPGTPEEGPAEDGPAGSAPAGVSTTGAEGPTAAARFGWGRPDREDEFTAGSADWAVHQGPGHDGQGLRSADALTIEDGDVLVITGDPAGTTGGLCWDGGQRYGRWEGRVRAPVSDPSYDALMLLWPAEQDFPAGGQIAFMEMLDPTRRTTDFFLHHGADGGQLTSRVRVDGTQWHNWAVEWTPEAVVGYVDGQEWFRGTDPDTFPPGPMQLCLQLDWFPVGAGPVRESRMEVDRVRRWSLDETSGDAGG